MTLSRSQIAVLVLACTSWIAAAQPSAPPIALPDLPAASGPRVTPPGAPGPRQRGLAETGGGAAAPGDLKPERPVSPQISIPFGKKAPPPPTREDSTVRRSTASNPSGVDDAAARCESGADQQANSRCPAKPAGEVRVPPPR